MSYDGYFYGLLHGGYQELQNLHRRTLKTNDCKITGMLPSKDADEHVAATRSQRGLNINRCEKAVVSCGAAGRSCPNAVGRGHPT